jgi:hypothetical protein
MPQVISIFDMASRRVWGGVAEADVDHGEAVLNRWPTPALSQVWGGCESTVAAGRHPTVAQVRKMLAANDNAATDFIDDSEVASEYAVLFQRCLTESGDVNSLIRKLSKELRVNSAALAAIVNELTGSTFSKVGLKDAKAAILDEFAHRDVASMAKRAAGDSKPF